MTSTSYRITTAVFGGVGTPVASANYKSDSTMDQSSPLMDPFDPPYSKNYDNFPGFWHTSADNDGDGLLNALEDTIGLVPGDADSDDDGDEVAAGTDPLDPNDHPANIPTLSEWGMIIMALLLMTVGISSIRRRQEQ